MKRVLVDTIKNREAMTILKKQLILNTKPNQNRRKYTVNALEFIASQINEAGANTFGTYGDPDETTFLDVSRLAFHVRDAVVEDECLYADIHIADSALGEDLKVKSLFERLVFRPNGQHTPNKGSQFEQMRALLNIDNVIDDGYELKSFSAFSADLDAIVV